MNIKQIIRIVILTFLLIIIINLSWVPITNSYSGHYIDNLSNIKYIQMKLKSYGFYMGPIDGILGNETNKAIYDYRISYNFPLKPLAQINDIVEQINLGLNLSPYLLSNTYPPDIAYIKQRGKIIVGMLDNSRFPFSYGTQDPTNKLFTKGFDIELINQIAQGLNVSIELNLNAKTYDDLIQLLITKKVDVVVSKLSITKERIPSIMFTNPYASLRRTIITKRDNLPRNISFLGDDAVNEIFKNFKGTIGIFKHSAYNSFVKEDFPNAVIKEYETWNLAIKDLINNNVDMLFRDETEMLVLTQLFPSLKHDFVIYAIRNKVDNIGIGLTTNSFGLLNYLNSLIASNGKALSTKRLITYIHKEFLNYQK